MRSIGKVLLQMLGMGFILIIFAVSIYVSVGGARLSGTTEKTQVSINPPVSQTALLKMGDYLSDNSIFIFYEGVSNGHATFRENVTTANGVISGDVVMPLKGEWTTHVGSKQLLVSADSTPNSSKISVTVQNS